MAVKIIKEDDHEHVLKMVNEEVEGLIADDRKTDLIAEAFGWPEEKFTKFCNTYKAYRDYQLATENLEEDLPKSTKVSSLVDFLKSPSFKKLGITLHTPNDYLMVGFAFMAVVNRRDEMNGIPQVMGGEVNGHDLLKILKILSKKNSGE